jgi:hypothetical protein
MRPKVRKRKKKGMSLISIRKQHFYFLVALVLLIAVVFTGVRLLGSYRSVQNQAAWALSLRDASQDEGTNYLLYGLSDQKKDIFIEELFLLHFPATDSEPRLFFIPGKVLLHRLQNAENGLENDSEEDNEHLSSFYTPSHFYSEGGAKYLIEQLSFFLGIPVHHYLEINYEGIPEMVDYKGTIPYREYTLQGRDYFAYFMNPEDEEPLELALRRAKMLGNVVEFLSDEGGFFSTPKLLSKVAQYLSTDLSWKELNDFYKNLDPLFKSEQLVITIPGTWKEINGDELFFEPEWKKINEMTANLGDDFTLPPQVITVEVLNGSGAPGVASRVGEMLHEAGFQVVSIDNADHFDYQLSQVISRVDDIGAAKDIAEIIPGAEFLKDPIPQHPAMVTVILGKNFTLP